MTIRDLVPELFQPVLEGFDVGDDPVDMGEVGFCKKCNTHGTRSCSFGVVVCGCGFRQLPDDRGPLRIERVSTRDDFTCNGRRWALSFISITILHAESKSRRPGRITFAKSVEKV